MIPSGSIKFRYIRKHNEKTSRKLDGHQLYREASKERGPKSIYQEIHQKMQETWYY